MTLEDRLLAPLISPLLCLGGTEACLMNHLWVRSLGVLFRLDRAVSGYTPSSREKPSLSFVEVDSLFMNVSSGARVPCLREKIGV